jgi:diguanylate cyclase (GGDEF)-like protein
MPRSYGLSHIAFLVITGLAGWLAVVLFTIWQGGLFRPVVGSWEFAATFMLAALSRLLAVRIFRRVRIALDSAYYVSASFIFGVVPSAWMVMLILTTDGLVRFWRGTGLVRVGESPLRHVLAQTLNNGGLPALMLLGVGLIFGVDTGHPYSDLHLAWVLPAYAVTFLVTHYSVAGSSQLFLGEGTRTLMRDFFVKVVLAELFLVPLALAMVLGYVHQGIGLYVLLGATCLLFNIIFRRASLAGEKLQARVEELSTLDKVGRIISGSLERRALLSNIARETLRLVRHTSRFMIGTLERKDDLIRYELFDEAGKSYRTIIAPKNEGLSGWVLSHRTPLLLREVQREYPRYAKSSKYNDPSFHSWLGVPLIIYDEVVGVLSVQSEQPHAYTNDHLRVLTTIADQASVALQNSRLFELATIDGLTSLLVRRHFEQRLEEEWHRANRYGGEFAFGIIDLDNFKHLNDNYGHQAGDQVLRSAAAVLRRNMRTADLAGRYGGEEFAFILPRTRLAECLTVAERIRADVERMATAFGGQQLRVTTSIGISAYPESAASHVAELVALADEAMYQAKRQGKNRVCVSPGAAAQGALPKATSPLADRGVI